MQNMVNNYWLALTFYPSFLQVMQWSQRPIQIFRCLCPSLTFPGSHPSALRLRWLWFPFWPALPKRPRLPRSAPWRAWRPPLVALQWGAMTVRARVRHLMLRASPHCHKTRSASYSQPICASPQVTNSQLMNILHLCIDLCTANYWNKNNGCTSVIQMNRWITLHPRESLHVLTLLCELGLTNWCWMWTIPYCFDLRTNLACRPDLNTELLWSLRTVCIRCLLFSLQTCIACFI